ncbi:MAG: hypothetical protein A2934_04895 [Candidatus Sungbacteria bacterium RIFCSPLOWO2_01_FULL_47_10]|uniref:Uncharacterized protein n=1 Tax=Candidatus Sungbacteria bacterium RIFCSPLOWO2_01_FULL_47_10 TaxID=1802276 RepID=A0A1G2L9X4_9BACT|nr:MAG: hypothetical protein A2934_04895 [Candidatus Sungbacteria bacterium RIFCSPLOWO2_01_FULL_47_10]
MPQKRIIRFWNFQTGLAAVCALVVLYNLYLWLAGKGGLDLPLVLLMLLVAIVLLFETEHPGCYYCKKAIHNYQPRAFVWWTEPVVHSGEVVTMRKEMHLSCHEQAVPEKRFRIPVPGQESFEI